MSQESTELVWTLNTALDLFKQLDDCARLHGFFLSMAGGVIRNGLSYHDLDLVLTQRSLDAKLSNFLEALPSVGVHLAHEVVERPTWSIYKASYNKLPIDFFNPKQASNEDH